MKHRLSLSVVIPSHNKSKYIKQCIESIKKQTFQVKEIIVFDDNSTDGTKGVLRELESCLENLIVIYSDTNVGVSTARDIAIKRASADYVTFIDADDFYWDERKLECEMRKAEEYYQQNKSLCCTFSQTVLVNECGDRIDAKELKNWEKLIRFGTVTRLYRYWVPRDYCMPKELYLRIGGYDTNMSLYEDWDLNLRLLSVSEFKFSGVYGTAYRLNTDGLSSENAEKHYLAKKKVFENNKKNLNISVLEKIVFYLFLYLAYIKSYLK